ncbi:unnamed protein product [Brassica napus]|uniref:(rape) hypothetical protein n=1 Tax=Brassica napus TaxID=3708 RepID=A0A816Q862_BRANA|nr:unnamed protein product [Brassica napus]
MVFNSAVVVAVADVSIDTWQLICGHGVLLPVARVGSFPSLFMEFCEYTSF